MPRRYYRRRTVAVRPKKKWASNMIIRNYVINSDNPSPVITLVANSLQSGTPTPVIVKAGNFKINADIGVAATAGSSGDIGIQLMAVVLYLPEGNGIPNNTSLGAIVGAHPEYIMAWRQFDTSTPTTSTSFAREVVFSSRLKRNLNSGDSIVFGVLSSATGVTVNRIVTSVTAQFWTCAN